MDPVYTYIKGKGWVAGQGLTITDSYGKYYKLEYRVPLKGEKYKASKHEDLCWVTADGTPKDEAILEALNGINPSWLSTCKVPADRNPNKWFYVVVVPFD